MRRASTILVGVFMWLAPVAATADLWESVYRGLDLLATPSGNPITTTGDGTRINGGRLGRVRIVPNGVVGKGYRVEFDRVFGVDSSGRTETFRFAGLGDLTLSGAVQATAGYTKPRKGLYFGEASFTANNLSYDLQTRNGVQDARLTGTLAATGTLNANVFGSYDLTLNVSNTNSEFTVDGVAANDDTNTNFNVGPISVKGNLYVDLISGILTNSGLRALDLESLFPASAGPFLNDAADEAVQENAANANLDTRSRVASLMVQAILGQNQDAAEELMSTLVASDGINLSPEAEVAQDSTLTIPEAGTLTLLVAGGSLLTLRRRS